MLPPFFFHVTISFILFHTSSHHTIFVFRLVLPTPSIRHLLLFFFSADASHYYYRRCCLYRHYFSPDARFTLYTGFNITPPLHYFHIAFAIVVAAHFRAMIILFRLVFFFITLIFSPPLMLSYFFFFDEPLSFERCCFIYYAGHDYHDYTFTLMITPAALFRSRPYVALKMLFPSFLLPHIHCFVSFSRR